MNTIDSNKSFKKSTSDPASRNYPKQMKNKENQKSPYGEKEPSSHTTYK